MYESLFSEIRARFVRRLQTGPLKGWQPSNIVTLAFTSVDELRPQIKEYLKGKEVTLANADQVIEEVIENVLIPNLRIKLG